MFFGFTFLNSEYKDLSSKYFFLTFTQMGLPKPYTAIKSHTGKYCSCSLQSHESSRHRQSRSEPPADATGQVLVAGQRGSLLPVLPPDSSGIPDRKATSASASTSSSQHVHFSAIPCASSDGLAEDGQPRPVVDRVCAHARASL